MSIYKVCEKCGDYPCHCGHEFKDKSTGYILETINNLQALYNSRVEKDAELTINVGTKPIHIHMASLKHTDSIAPLSIEVIQELPDDWIKHIRTFKNCEVRDMMQSIIKRGWTTDDFRYPSLYILFLLQRAGHLNDRNVLGLILHHTISRVKVSTHATIQVLQELKSSLSKGVPEFANHAWTVYKTLKTVQECDPRDVCLFELFYRFAQDWINNQFDIKPDRYTKFMTLCMACLTLSIELYEKVHARCTTNTYTFIPDGYPWLRDELFFSDMHLTEDIYQQFQQEIESTPNNLEILQD
jgi:hypothetical protein